MIRKKMHHVKSMGSEPVVKIKPHTKFSFPCDKCPYVDRTAFLLEHHIESVHEAKVENRSVKNKTKNDKKNKDFLKCPSCSYLSTYPQLLRHMKAHKCGFCDFKYDTKEDMHSHLYEAHNKLILGNIMQILPEVAYRDGNGALYCTCERQSKKPEAMLRHQTVCQKIVIPSEAAQLLLIIYIVYHLE